MAQQVSDDVWSQVNPSSARLPPRVRRRLIIAAVAVIVLIVAGAQITASGAVVPRIAAEPGWNGWFEDGTTSDSLVNRHHRSGPATTHVSHRFGISNTTADPVRIAGVDTDRPGMRVERVDVGLPGSGAAGSPTTVSYLLKPGEVVPVRIYYDITDCSAVPAVPQPVPFVVDQGDGPQRVEIALPPLRPHRTGGWTVSPGDPKAVQWQRFLADHVCGIPYPDGL